MFILKKNDGFVAVLAIFIMLVVAFITISMIARSSTQLSMEGNLRKKIQSFYASDGQLTLLAQETIDGNGNKYLSSDYLIYDNFNRKNSDVIGNGWIETREDGYHKVSLLSNLVLFKASQSYMKPILNFVFEEQNSGKLILQFEMNWARISIDTVNNDNNYEVLIQLGDNMEDGHKTRGSAVFLRWGDDKTGFSTHEGFGYIKPEYQGVQLKKISGIAYIKVIIDLDTKKYDILINGKEYASKVNFYENVSKVNKLRFFCNMLSSSKFCGQTFDNINLRTSNSDNEFTDTTQAGDFSVAWDLLETSAGKYKIKTLSFLDGRPENKMFKTRLNQVLELPAMSLFSSPEDSVKIPATIYDFHSDRSNPEFEQPHEGNVLKKNMVKKKLDSDGKPILGTNPFLNYYIKYWFVDSKSILLTDTIFLYKTTQTLCKCTSDEWKDNVMAPPDPAFGKVAAAYAFRNEVIDTSLVFYHIGGGVYQYNNPSFFIINGKGLGNEWNVTKNCYGQNTPNNYAFTVELECDFLKVPGQKFKFNGDDDLWVFINDSLVMELGGIHFSSSDSIEVDSLKNLEYYTVYKLKFFGAERHSGGSSYCITTNLFQLRPVSVKKQYWKKDYGNIF